jgi:hypothetical protein
MGEFLAERRRTGRPALLVVDNAQSLSRELWEEIRQLCGLAGGDPETGPEGALSVLLAGQPELEGVLAELDLARRVALRWVVAWHLWPAGRPDTVLRAPAPTLAAEPARDDRPATREAAAGASGLAASPPPRSGAEPPEPRPEPATQSAHPASPVPEPATPPPATARAAEPARDERARDRRACGGDGPRPAGDASGAPGGQGERRGEAGTRPARAAARCGKGRLGGRTRRGEVPADPGRRRPGGGPGPDGRDRLAAERARGEGALTIGWRRRVDGAEPLRRPARGGR